MTQIFKTTLALVSVFMIFSCSNNEEIGTTQSNSIINQLQNNLHLDQFENTNISENLQVNWNDVNKTSTNGVEIYEIEMSEKEMTTITSGIFQEKLKYQLIGIKRNDALRTYLIEAFSNIKNSLYSQSIKDLHDYSGFLNVYDFNGNNLGQISIKEGKALSTAKNQVLIELINTINLFSKPSLKSLTNRIANCVYTVPIYHEIFLEKYKIVQTVEGKVLSITFLGEKKIDSYTTYMSVSYPCESGGDEIHIPYRRKEYEIQIIDVKIDASGLTGKAKCLNDLLSKNGNSFVQKLLANFQGKSEFDINIVSKDNVFKQDDNGNLKEVNGATFPPSNNAILIQISTSRSNNQTALDAARTILHEYIHADIWRKLATTNNVVATDFKKLYGLYDSQHGAMAGLYLNSMKEALKEFHKNALTEDYNKYVAFWGHEPSDAFYEAMAWGGLQENDVKDWVNLPDEKKKEIIALASNENKYLTKNAPCP